MSPRHQQQEITETPSTLPRRSSRLEIPETPPSPATVEREARLVAEREVEIPFLEMYENRQSITFKGRLRPKLIQKTGKLCRYVDPFLH